MRFLLILTTLVVLGQPAVAFDFDRDERRLSAAETFRRIAVAQAEAALRERGRPVHVSVVVIRGDDAALSAQIERLARYREAICTRDPQSCAE